MSNLSISHRDFDGAVCSILIRKVFKDTILMAGTYSNVNAIFRNHAVPKDWDNIFITDISIDEKEFKEFITTHFNLHFIDHHPRAEASLISNQLHSTKAAGCYLTMLYLKKYFNYEPSKPMENLVKFGNDYDTWKHEFKISKVINRLFYYYGFEKFVKRFEHGFIEFNEDEKEFIVKNNNYLQELFKKTEYLKITPEVYLIMVSEAIDEVADYFLKMIPELDTVFILNPKNNNLSMRGNHHIDYGKFLIPFGGGGHFNAAAIRIKDPNDTHKIIEKYIEERKEQNVF